MAAGFAPAALGVAVMSVLGLALFGHNVVWSEPGVTLSEAVATRDRGMIVRLLRERHDPGQVWRVREEMLGRSQVYWMTAFEVAVVTDRPEIMALLEGGGRPVEGAARRRLVCFARRVDARSVLEYLDVNSETVDCSAGDQVNY